MRQPPPLNTAPNYPVTAGTAVLAIAVTVPAMLIGASIEPLTLNFRFVQEPWRLVTSALPHGGVLHLAFNVFWLWTFGSVLEERWGSLKLLGVFVLLSAGSMAAEHAILDGGKGLSGIGYGLFGILLASSRLDPRRADDMDSGTAQVFIVWGIICVVTTFMGIMAVANIAHGMGLLLGLLVGAAASAPDAMRRTAAAIAAPLLAAICVAAAHPAVRPMVNLSSTAGDDEAEACWLALEDDRNLDALKHCVHSVDLGQPSGGRYNNLGVALQRLGQRALARQAFARAHELEPYVEKYEENLANMDAPRFMMIDTSGSDAPQ